MSLLTIQTAMQALLQRSATRSWVAPKSGTPTNSPSELGLSIRSRTKDLTWSFRSSIRLIKRKTPRMEKIRKDLLEEVTDFWLQAEVVVRREVQVIKSVRK